MSDPLHSSIQEHYEGNHHPLKFQIFTVIDSTGNQIKLRTLESICIRFLKQEMI